MICFVIDVNGVLIKRIWSKSTKQSNEYDNVIPMPGKNGAQHVYVRPHALSLIKAIADKPNVRLVFWSSMTLEYMLPIVDMLTTKAGVVPEKYTAMSQMDCMVEKHPVHSYKPLFVKNVERIYERFPNSEGTVFVDDSVDKMKYNEDEVIVIVKPWSDHKDLSDSTLKTEIIDDLDNIIQCAIDN